MKESANSWIKFLRRYGPVPRNDNMFDETIQRAARRAKIAPIFFEHPLRTTIRTCFDCEGGEPLSVILTGEAGDGKTHLCREIWELLKGAPDAWATDEPYLAVQTKTRGDQLTTVHIIRDLSAWVPQREAEWPAEKLQLLQLFSQSLFAAARSDYFLIAANDGQLIETWRRLPDSPEVIEVRDLFETLLVEERDRQEGLPLRFFNLSRSRSAALLQEALNAFINHEGWKECYAVGQRAGELITPEASGGEAGGNEFFGPRCPIRRNYEVLASPLFQKRLLALFELCDHNGLHIPIRQILLLLSNTVLGHPEQKDHLMVPADVPKIIAAGTVSKASIYNNVFGGNLSEAHRDSIPVFNHLDRFRIGFETTNRVDNLLIFGEANEGLKPYFKSLIGADPFYGADDAFRRAQWDYIEGAEEDEVRTAAFLTQLVAQRRALFFKIPEGQEDELKLWELTVFQFAGEYLSRVVGVLNVEQKVERHILARLIRGLNRIFVGMLISSDRDVFLATSLAFSNAKVSRMLEERISVSPRLGEKVEVLLDNGKPALRIMLSPTRSRILRLNLTRYEFLSRVAEGALPNSFSKECYEDVLAFKSQVLAALEERRRDLEEDPSAGLIFRLLNLDDTGNPTEDTVEVQHV